MSTRRPRPRRASHPGAAATKAVVVDLVEELRSRVTINPATTLASTEPYYYGRHVRGPLAIAAQPVLAVDGDAGRVLLRLDVAYATTGASVRVGGSVKPVKPGDVYYVNVHVTAPRR